MPGRNYQSSSSYRYGFNGKENVDEIIANGRWQDYGERDYRSDLGRFIKVDPLTKKYPYYSSYQFAGNKPIAAIDLDGEEESIRIISTLKGQTHITTIAWNKVYPGQEHGSKGTGTLDYKKDEKTGKWDNGKYVKSFADLHPIKAFFGSEYNDRYQDTKGLYQLGKDVKTGGKALGKASTYAKLAGVAITLSSVVLGPEVIPIGVATYNVGGRMEDASDVIAISSEAVEGDVGAVIKEGAKFGTGKVFSTSIEGTTMNEANKVITDYIGGTVVDAVAPENEESKKTND